MYRVLNTYGCLLFVLLNRRKNIENFYNGDHELDSIPYFINGGPYYDLFNNYNCFNNYNEYSQYTRGVNYAVRQWL